MKIFNFLLMAVATLGLSSCLGHSSNSVTSDFSNYILAYVTDNSVGDTRLSSGATYKVSNNFDDGTVSVTIGNLKLPNGTNISFDLKDLKVRYNDKGGMVLNVPSYSTQSGSQSYAINNFDFVYYNRYYNGAQYPMLVNSFEVDSRYSVRLIYTPAVYWGTTTVVDQDGNSFTNSDLTSFYAVGFDPETRRGSVAIYGARFAQNMPAMSMLFPNIPFTIGQNSYSLQSSEITPQIGGTPYPSYKITDFSMNGTYGGTQIVKFTCTIDTEKIKGVYKVTALLEIIPDMKQDK